MTEFNPKDVQAYRGVKFITGSHFYLVDENGNLITNNTVTGLDLAKAKVELIAGIEKEVYLAEKPNLGGCYSPGLEGRARNFIVERGQKPKEGLCLLLSLIGRDGFYSLLCTSPILKESAATLAKSS
ncbi:hypothetical protein JXB27_02820 [Candidatus Woesearchaeota archaeon]|nr:hypothetical protein [Candidatus Woesearchaeota archaeon]